MKKIALFVSVFAFVGSVFALEVNTTELQSLNGNTEIEFINYEGPHSVINTVAQIKGIGSEIGAQVAGNLEKSDRIGNNARYSVIHAVDTSVKEKLDADILIIGSESQLDHINNLRRIISGYLTAAYKYSETDADTLAVFITVYNAVYRAKLDVFAEKYKEAVISHLESEICGLSVDYHDWAGKTQIVIPLFDVTNGGLSTIDTSVISDKNVVSSMKEDDDKNIQSRKNLVDIKERESETANQNAKDAQKKAAEDNKKLDEEKARTEQAKKDAEAAKKDADEKQKIAAQNPDDKQAQEDAKKAKDNAKQKQKELEKQEEKQKEQSEKTEKSREESKKQQELADKKDSEAQKERKDIAIDQVAVQREKAENDAAGSEYALIILDEKKPLLGIVRYNKVSGKQIKKPAVNVIRSRQMINLGDKFLTIAGENKGNGAVKLVLIDKETLEIAQESEEMVSETSVIVPDGGEYYCVINEKGSYHIGRFDSNLKLKSKSVEKVKAGTPITINANAIAVTGADGKVKVLNKADISTLIGE